MTTRKKIGYNVYHAPEGSSPSFYGFARTLRDAKKLSRGPALEKSLWHTAQIAGHCAGISAPEGIEADEPSHWWGKGGWDCAVPVYEDDSDT